MRIGILGVGSIGKILIRKLSEAGHRVCFANLRGPENLIDLAAETGATAVTTVAELKDVDVVILAVPFGTIPGLQPLIASLSTSTSIIDTSNYDTERDGQIETLQNDEVEGVWVEKQLRRPIARAWNTMPANSLELKGLPKGSPGRLAIPVSSSDDRAKQIAMTLVDDTGFEAVDAGSIEESWRIERGNPAFGTELTAEQLTRALSLGDRKHLARGDALMSILQTWAISPFPWDNEELLRVQCAVACFSGW